MTSQTFRFRRFLRRRLFFGVVPVPFPVALVFRFLVVLFRLVFVPFRLVVFRRVVFLRLVVFLRVLFLLVGLVVDLEVDGCPSGSYCNKNVSYTHTQNWIQMR